MQSVNAICDGCGRHVRQWAATTWCIQCATEPEGPHDRTNATRTDADSVCRVVRRRLPVRRFSASVSAHAESFR